MYYGQYQPTTLSEWYRGVAIPRFSDRNSIVKFTSSVTGLAISFITDKIKCSPTVYITKDVETAAVDIETLTIYISERYIDPVAANRLNPKVTSELKTLEAMIGSTIHELFHIEHTNKTMEEMVKIAGIDDELFTTIMNVVEDLYIDNDALHKIGPLKFAYDSRVNYLFPIDAADTALDEMSGNIDTLTDVFQMANTLIMLKNYNNTKLRTASLGVHFNTLRSMVMSSTRKSNIFDRIDLAVNIYKYLTKNIQSELSKIPKANLKGDGEQTEGGDKMSPGEQKALEKLITQAFDNDDASKVEKATERLDSDNVVYKTNSDGSSKIEAVADADVFRSLGLNPDPSAPSIEPDARFIDFASLIRARTIVNRPCGRPMDRGRKIKRLHRIATDSKIFADPIEVDSLGEQEILVLVDLSRSMKQHDKVANALRAAYGAALGLEEGRHRVAIYGHTADVDLNTGWCGLFIVRIKSFDEPASVIESRMRVVYGSNRNMMCSNADDHAITHVAEAFSGIQNNKTLIVISDGMPSAAYTLGVDGTRAAAEKIRESGINVLSISIERDAVCKNDEIYGTDNNYDSSDPGVVFKIIESF